MFFNSLHTKHIFFVIVLGINFTILTESNEIISNQANTKGFEHQLFMAESLIKHNNIKDALHWIKKAQNHKNEDSLLKLAYMLLKHSIISLDQKAAAILHQAAKLQSGQAAYKLANLYKTGIGVNVNLKHSIKWLKKAATLGHINAQIDYAKVLLEMDSDQATSWLLSSSISNKSTSLMNIALHRSITSSQFSTSQKIKLLSRAHDLGNLKASSYLVKYLIPFKPKTALEIAKTAVKTGESIDLYQYAILLEPHAKTDKQIRKVVDLYRRAADQNHSSALYKLGNILLKHPNLSLSSKEAFSSISRAAKLGIADAQFQLGNWLQYGISSQFKQLDKNPKMALKWYLKAANQGHSEASYEIGLFHEHGIATSINLKKATKWYKIAKKYGSNKAKIGLLRISKKQSIFYKIKHWWKKH